MENKSKYKALVKTKGKKESFQIQCCSIRCHWNDNKQWTFSEGFTITLSHLP